MKTKLLITGLAILGSINLSAYTYEVQPLIGQNFTEDGAAVDDSTAFGLRLNKYISPNNAIMFGYTRITDADYNKNVIQKVIKSNRSCGVDPCAPKKIDPCATKSSPCTTDYEEDDNYDNCPTTSSSSNTKCQVPTSSSNTSNNGDTDRTVNNGSQNLSGGNSSSSNSASNGNGLGMGSSNGSNGATSGNGNMANGSNGATNGNGNITNGSNGASNKPHQPTINKPTINKPNKKLKPASNSKSKAYKRASTDIDRFYINGLHNIDLQYSRLKPYVYAGFGYERVDKEYNDYKSQGFFDAGMGLKFGINDKVSLLADIQGIKKFRDNDLDILASLGLGFFFGATHQIAPETKVVDVAPKAEPNREITIIKVKPKPVVKSTTTTQVAPKGEYYIQLAAAFKQDVAEGCHFTEEMDKEGIAYDVKYTTIKGKNASILVTGPYSSREEAKEELAKIRKISKDAFIRKFDN